jgi:hypothetical protein
MNAVRRGFDFKDVDFVIHIEDDIVPSRDMLAYFEWASQTYRDDPQIYTVTGFFHTAALQDDNYAVRRQDWFSSWGWGTWRRSWDELGGMSTSMVDYAWDTHINNTLRRGRLEIAPLQSRFQNIGKLGGTNMSPEVWEYMHCPVFIPDLEPGPYKEIFV